MNIWENKNPSMLLAPMNLKNVFTDCDDMDMPSIVKESSKASREAISKKYLVCIGNCSVNG